MVMCEVSWRWPEGVDATHSWEHWEELAVPLTSMGFQSGCVSAVERNCLTQHRGVPRFLSLSNSWQSHWLVSKNILFPVARAASWIWLFFRFLLLPRFGQICTSGSLACCWLYKPKLGSLRWRGLRSRSRSLPLWWDSTASSPTPVTEQRWVSAQQLPCRRSVPPGSCRSSACSWQRKWHLFSVPAVSSTEVPKPKCLSSRSRSEEGFLMPDHGLAFRGREGDRLLQRWWAGRNGKGVTNRESKNK